MKIATFTLLPDTNDQINVVSKAFQCAGYYRNQSVFNTITIFTNKLLGRIYFEGSLAQYPTENDWFPILINGKDCIEFDGSLINHSEYHNINNNMTNIRVKLDRSYIDNLDISNMGKINKIYLSY